MARVYKAYDPKLNRYVALKFIRSDNVYFVKQKLRLEQDKVCFMKSVKVKGAVQLIQGVTLQEHSRNVHRTKSPDAADF